MAVNMHAPKMPNWWVWGGAAVAVIIVIAAMGYGLDWFGTGATTEVAPAIEQAVPATD
jgi:hypothetical protein